MIDIYQCLVLGVVVFFLTGIYIVLLSKWSFQLGLIDAPGGRKKHRQSTPLIGGIAIYLGVCGTLLFYKEMHQLSYYAYLIASLLLMCISILDDKRCLLPRSRFFAQIASVFVIIFVGNTALFSLGDLLGIGELELKRLTVPFTCFAMIGIINAVNMMDGVDGLTGGVSFVECLILLLLSCHLGVVCESLLLTAILGGLGAFLLFNFPHRFSEHRKIFLGDAGSMFLGLTLAWVCVRLTQCENGYPPVLMLWIMALPLMDTLRIIVNRKARGVSPFKADRRHMHHILLLLKYTTRQTITILIATSFLLGMTGIFLYQQKLSEWLLFSSYVMLFLLYMSVSYGFKKRIVSKKEKIFRKYERSV